MDVVRILGEHQVNLGLGKMSWKNWMHSDVELYPWVGRLAGWSPLPLPPPCMVFKPYVIVFYNIWHILSHQFIFSNSILQFDKRAKCGMALGICKLKIFDLFCMWGCLVSVPMKITLLYILFLCNIQCLWFSATATGLSSSTEQVQTNAGKCWQWSQKRRGRTWVTGETNRPSMARTK